MMELFVLYSLLSVMNFSFKVVHPLVMGMGLLSILVLVSLGIIFYGSLYSFCLFMVMVGGVLVVFSYTISLVPFSSEKMVVDSTKSEKFEMKMNLMLSFVILGGLSLSMVLEKDWMMWSMFSNMMYFSVDWGTGVVWMSLLLFLVMVFSVSVASKYKGALLK